MTYSGSFFYDDPSVHQQYQQLRHHPNSANDTIEKPIISDMIGDVAHKAILDLGCGEALMASDWLAQGATSYMGIDGSHNMIQLAQRRLCVPQAKVEHAYLESWQYPHGQFDLVVSRLAFHYIEDLAPVFAHIYEALCPHGRLVFSVEHPVVTSHQVKLKAGSKRQDWVVDRYFHTGPRHNEWLGARLMTYHRTVEDYVHLLKTAGFTLDDLRESRPRRDIVKDPKLYEQRCRVPIYLFLAGQKPDTIIAS